MNLKIRKANDTAIYIGPGPDNCRKWHVTVDKDGSIEGIKCFALRKKPKCRNCWLAHTIDRRNRTKSGSSRMQNLKK